LKNKSCGAGPIGLAILEADATQRNPNHLQSSLHMKKHAM